MPGPYERLLAGEMIAVMGTQTFDALSGADTGKFKLPDPSRYFATVVVFTILAGVSLFGDKLGRLAATFGGVAALGIIMTPSKTTGKAPVTGALAYFAQIIGGGWVQTPTAGTSAGTPVAIAPGTSQAVQGIGPTIQGGAAAINP